MDALKKLNRTQILLIVLVAVVLLWQGSGFISSVAFGPFRARRDRLNELEKAVEQKRLQADAIDFARGRLRGWRSRSLAPDEANATTSKRPDALKSHLKYQEWITDLVALAGFDSPSIRPAPGRSIAKNGNSNVYLTMTVTIEGDATYGQLCTFLDHFYRTNLMHRITRLNVDSRESTGDPIMRVLIDAEAMAIADVTPRRTMFTETSLRQPLAADARECEVAGSDGFPKKPPFRIRIGSEFLTVTAVTGNRWSLTRAVERTHPADYGVGTVVEFTPLNPAFPSMDADEFRTVLKANPFIKPPPPKKYELKIGPLAEQAFVRGKTFEYTIPTSDYDPTLGKPEFNIVSGAPPGLHLDRGTGKIVWKPADDQSIGKFPLKIEARHPSAPDGKKDATLTLIFREPNTTPVARSSTTPVAYIGREWTYKLDVKDPETSTEKLQIKLGEGAPEGLSVKMPEGELRWTPPETLKPGEFNVPVTITDDGTPPQSTTLSVKVKLEDDAAQFTKLVGIVSVQTDAGEKLVAFFYNQLQDQSQRLSVGDTLKASEIEATVAEIKPKFVLLKRGEELNRLDIGRYVRELEPVSAAPSPTEAAELPAAPR